MQSVRDRAEHPLPPLDIPRGGVLVNVQGVLVNFFGGRMTSYMSGGGAACECLHPPPFRRSCIHTCLGTTGRPKKAAMDTITHVSGCFSSQISQAPVQWRIQDFGKVVSARFLESGGRAELYIEVYSAWGVFFYPPLVHHKGAYNYGFSFHVNIIESCVMFSNYFSYEL